MEQIKRLIKYLFRSKLLKRQINQYDKKLKAGEKFKVVFGGHWSDNPGWLILSESEQDITKPLELKNNIADIVFTEHVIEHVSFINGVRFMREAKRILKPGGVFRVVCPSAEKILSNSFEDENGKEYLKSLERFYPDEHKLFAEWNFDGLNEFKRTFLLNSIFTGYGHKFIWSAELMAKVLKSAGYKEPRIYKVGEGSNDDYCIERRRRGVYLGDKWKEDRSAGYIYDAESIVVEATK
jgi:SAM-dependent methyltransferase